MLRRFYQAAVCPILRAHDSPRAVARGAALGLGIAMVPLFGLHLPLAWILATVCGGNRIAALATVWVSNPFTVLPLCYAEYLLGCRFLDRDGMTTYHDFAALWASMAEQSYLQRLGGFSDAVLLPLLVGAVALGCALGAVTYPVVLSLLRQRASRRRAQELPP